MTSEQAAEVDPDAAIGTVLLASNEDGLRFAAHRGFEEIDRYTLPGETVEWIDLRRPLR